MGALSKVDWRIRSLHIVVESAFEIALEGPSSEFNLRLRIFSSCHLALTHIRQITVFHLFFLVIVAYIALCRVSERRHISLRQHYVALQFVFIELGVKKLVYLALEILPELSFETAFDQGC